MMLGVGLCLGQATTEKVAPKRLGSPHQTPKRVRVRFGFDFANQTDPKGGSPKEAHTRVALLLLLFQYYMQNKILRLPIPGLDTWLSPCLLAATEAETKPHSRR